MRHTVRGTTHGLHLDALILHNFDLRALQCDDFLGGVQLNLHAVGEGLLHPTQLLAVQTLQNTNGLPTVLVIYTLLRLAGCSASDGTNCSGHAVQHPTKG